jgi:hypothetical protein
LASPLEIFVLDIDGKPALTFAAVNLAVAEAVCGDPHLRSDLCVLTSSGRAICGPDSIMSARTADLLEIAAYEHALSRAPTSEEPTMAFLIQVDGVVMVTIDN